jgi:hypothetical protein
MVRLRRAHERELLPNAYDRLRADGHRLRPNHTDVKEEPKMILILLWLLGAPLVLIILLFLLGIGH